jgi:hypothetical protein
LLAACYKAVTKYCCCRVKRVLTPSPKMSTDTTVQTIRVLDQTIDKA